ncbi:MAG: hypothetical protein R3Y56_06145 [Akkermansia sp.]
MNHSLKAIIANCKRPSKASADTCSDLEKKYNFSLAADLKFLYEHFFGGFVITETGEQVNFFTLHTLIYDAEELLSVSVKETRLLPIIDLNDGNFVFYHIEDKSYRCQNLIDEICIYKTLELKEILQYICVI